MDDRITEIRAALRQWDAGELLQSDIARLAAAAREHLALLDSDALIIRRNENGKWPEWAFLVWDRWWLAKDEPGATALLDALVNESKRVVAAGLGGA